MTRPVSLACALLLASALMGGCRGERGGDPAADPRIVGERISFPAGAPQLGMLGVEPASRSKPAPAILSGRLVWNDDATARVFTPFAGRVRRVLVDVGQEVREGTPLAEVASPDFGEAQADERTAESDDRLARSNLDRIRDLYDHGAAARKELEAAEAELARSSAQRARTRARIASCGARADSVDGLFVLRSPIAGAVVERNLTTGPEIRPDQMLANAPQLFSPLFILSDPRRLWIEIDATESDVANLRAGAEVRLTTAALPGRSFGARIDHVSESIDPVTHAVRARGSLDNALRLLKAEMFVNLEFQQAASAEASLPARAVFLKGDRHYVFVEERPGTFARREIRVDAREDGDVRVANGVRIGERVVTDGCLLLEHLLD